MISIDDDGGVREAAMHAGASEFMVKPVARDDFGTALGRLVMRTSRSLIEAPKVPLDHVG